MCILHACNSLEPRPARELWEQWRIYVLLLEMSHWSKREIVEQAACTTLTTRTPNFQLLCSANHLSSRCKQLQLAAARFQDGEWSAWRWWWTTPGSFGIVQAFLGFLQPFSSVLQIHSRFSGTSQLKFSSAYYLMSSMRHSPLVGRGSYIEARKSLTQKIGSYLNLIEINIMKYIK